jgi:hypothetical protein
MAIRVCSACGFRHDDAHAVKGKEARGLAFCPNCCLVTPRRHLGELVDPNDTTSVEGWGGVSFG